MNGLHSLGNDQLIVVAFTASEARELVGLPTYNQDRENGLMRTMLRCECQQSRVCVNRHFFLSPNKGMAANRREGTCEACKQGRHAYRLDTGTQMR